MANYCGGEKILSPPRFQHNGGERPRCLRGSDAFGKAYKQADLLYFYVVLLALLLHSMRPTYSLHYVVNSTERETIYLRATLVGGRLNGWIVDCQTKNDLSELYLSAISGYRPSMYIRTGTLSSWSKALPLDNNISVIIGLSRDHKYFSSRRPYCYFRWSKPLSLSLSLNNSPSSTLSGLHFAVGTKTH